jgi:hypothetical protein
MLALPAMGGDRFIASLDRLWCMVSIMSSFLQDNGVYQEPSEILIEKIDPSKSIVLSRSLDPPSILKIPEVQSMLLVPVTLNLCPRLSQYLTLYIDVSVESRVV